jgi:hypothetical protein
MMQILGAVAGVVVLFLLFKMFTGGGGEEQTLPTPSGTVPPTVSPSVTPTETPRPTSPPIDLASDRDPFSIPPGLAASPTGGEVSPSSTGTAPVTSSPPVTTPPPTTGPPPTSPPPTSPPPTSPPPTSPPPPPPIVTDHITIGGHDVTLKDVHKNNEEVEVVVDGKLWTVQEGATFDDNFELVRILDVRCARFLYGDQSFELCLPGK